MAVNQPHRQGLGGTALRSELLMMLEDLSDLMELHLSTNSSIGGY
jgi:hypothetical protein